LNVAPLSNAPRNLESGWTLEIPVIAARTELKNGGK
jgi:hypothetical protein